MRFAALGMMNRVVILSLETGTQVARFSIPHAFFTRVRFSPEFKTVYAFNASSGTAFVWNIVSAEKRGEYKISEWGTPNEDGGFTIKFDQGELPIDFSNDGSLFAFHKENQPGNVTVIRLYAAQQ